MTTLFEKKLQRLRKGLHQVPAGTTIPADTPYVFINATGVAVLRSVGATSSITVPSSRAEYYVEEEFWKPNPRDEIDKSDRVLLMGDGTPVLRVIWNNRQRTWVVPGFTRLRVFRNLAEIVDQPNWPHLQLAFDTGTHIHPEAWK